LTLPIEAVLPDIVAALRTRSNLVIVAPPGAGKTTAVAPALLAEDWCSGEILLLSPRRIAARAAAERMAALAGERVGETIGYATRMDVKRSAKTSILVVTEGIFRNRIQAEPDLPSVSAVLFDEVHERSLDSDTGLAFALDAQAAFRPDLRIVAMSATLDEGRFGRLLDAPVIQSEGRSWPLAHRYIGRTSDRIEDDMAAAIRRALAETDGDVLAFLPGVAEIERTAERLNLSNIEVHKLHGTLDPAAQRAAIARSNARKVVLATSIAETSLTIDGVRIVVDSGLARRPRYDRGAGMTRLVTERASQAAVTQRAGRAARQAPGVSYRLWEEAATAGLPRFDPPEILEADLSALVLDCAIWGATDPKTLRWLDPPPDAAIAEARSRLSALEAIDGSGRATPHGKAIAALPLPPRLAHMLLRTPDKALAAEVAMLLSVVLAAMMPISTRGCRVGGVTKAPAPNPHAGRREGGKSWRARPKMLPVLAALLPSLSPTACQNAGRPMGPTGSASAGAGSGWTRPARSPGRSGSRSPKRRGRRQAHGFCRRCP
jgi:ATP-dependent helicase HrpB